MPSLGHLFLGAMIGLSLYYISDKKFTKYHAFILFMNNYLGPDVGWVTDIGWLSHTVFGFAIFAFPLAAIYSYFTRFSPDFKRKTLTDLGKSRVPFLNTYCVVLAGGILHNYFDGIINYGGIFYLFPSIGNTPRFDVAINDFTQFWSQGALGFNSSIAILVGIPFIMGFIYYFTGFLKHTPSKAILGTGIYIAVFLMCYYLLGYNMTFHGDAGAIIYASIFWGFPLGLCTLSVKIPVERTTQEQLPAEKTDVAVRKDVEMPKVLKKRVRGVIIGKITIVLFFVIGAFLLLAGVGLLVFSSYFVDWAVGYNPTFWAPYATAFTNFLLFGGIFIAFGGNVCIFAGVKLRQWNSPDFRLVLFHAWLFVSGFVCILVFIGALTLATPGAAYVFNNPELAGYVTPYFTLPEQLVLVVRLVGILMGILGLLNYVLGIGMLLRSERWRRLTFLYNICWAWSILGLVFACYLSQQDVRVKFHGKRDSSKL